MTGMAVQLRKGKKQGANVLATFGPKKLSLGGALESESGSGNETSFG
jgi:hypothetical protein